MRMSARHLRELLMQSELLMRREKGQFDFRRAHQAGFTFAQVFEAVDFANCSLHQCLRLLKQAGYTEACTEYLGDATIQMAALSTEVEEVASLLARLKSDGASFEEAKAALLDDPQYDKWRLLRMAGYSCADAHSTIDDLHSKWKGLGCDEGEWDESVSESCTARRLKRLESSPISVRPLKSLLASCERRWKNVLQ